MVKITNFCEKYSHTKISKIYARAYIDPQLTPRKGQRLFVQLAQIFANSQLNFCTSCTKRINFGNKNFSNIAQKIAKKNEIFVHFAQNRVSRRIYCFSTLIR